MRHQHLPGFILFVSVVTIGRNDEDNYFVVKYPILLKSVKRILNVIAASFEHI